MKLTKEDLVKKSVPCDTLVKNKNGNYVIRKGFYYRTSSEYIIADKLKQTFPNVEIIKCGNKFTAFKGGQTVAQGSHYYVEFKIKSE